MLGFIAFLLTKLPASESTDKKAFWYSEVKTSNAVFSKSSQWQIKQDNRWATMCLREEAICAKVYRQTDGRTDDGRRAIALAHSCNELKMIKTRSAGQNPT